MLHTPFDLGILAIFPTMSSLFLIFFAFFTPIQFFRLEVFTWWLVVVDGREAVFRVHAGGIVHSAVCTVQAFPVLFWYFVGFHKWMISGQ